MPKQDFVHIDDWLETTGVMSRDPWVRYAAFVIHHKRLSAVAQMAFEPFVKDHLLFCTYKGERYRVNVASRLGDLGLAKDLTRQNGYDTRVPVTECSDWGPNPEPVQAPTSNAT